MRNASGSDTTMTGYAVCINQPATQFTRVSSAPISFPDGAQTYGQAECPNDTWVVGGGVVEIQGDPGISVASSVPDVSGHAWDAWMNNNSGIGNTFFVYVTCRNQKPSGYSIRTGKTVANPAGTQVTDKVTCPGASVPLSGGDYTTSASTFVSINSSYPSGHTWINRQNNASSIDTVAIASVICAGT